MISSSGSGIVEPGVLPENNTPAGEKTLTFDEDYYRSHLGPAPYDRSNAPLLAFFAVIADQLIRALQPRTVLDAGCAMGFLVEALWDRGVHATGVDVSSYAIENVRRDIRPYCRAASLTEPIDGRYDLVTCIEVLEHMPPHEAMVAMDHITAITDVILFSSTSTDFDETTHVNIRQPVWWLEQFQQRGFSPDLIFDAGFVTPAAMLLRRRDTGYDWQVLRLFSEWLRYKSAVSARDLQINRLCEERDAAVAAPARYDKQSELNPQLARAAESTESIGDNNQPVMQLLAETQMSLEQLTAKHECLVATLEEVSSQRDNLLAGVNSFSVSGETDPNGSAATIAARLQARISEIASEVAAMNKRQNLLQEQVSDLRAQVRDIVTSRIWKTLVSAAGVLLRLKPGSDR